MKQIALYLLLYLLLPLALFAQNSKKKKLTDHHLDYDIYAFNISHTGKLKYNPNDLPEVNTKGGFIICPGRFDWIMPYDGSYAYSEGSGLMSAVLDVTLPSAGFLEMGYGWMFNNAKARKNNSFVTIQYGMGVGFGFRQFYNSDKEEGTLYGVLWPEFSSITSIGDRLEIIPKYIFNPIFSGQEWGLRTGWDVMAIYRLGGKFCLTARGTREKFNFNEKYETDRGTFSGKAVARSFQFGFAINVGQ